MTSSGSDSIDLTKRYKVCLKMVPSAQIAHCCVVVVDGGWVYSSKIITAPAQMSRAELAELERSLSIPPSLLGFFMA